MRKFAAALAMTALGAGGGAWAQSGAAWKPSRNVEVIVQSAAGGSSDRSAQTLRHLESETVAMQKLLAELGVIAR